MDKTKKIPLGEIFEVDGYLYAIQKPRTASEEMNDNGHQVLTFTTI